MDRRVARLQTITECDTFLKNALRLGHRDLAQQARQRSIEIRALSHDAQTQAEREAIEAIYAYETVLSEKRGRKTRASRTWQMIKRHGILMAVERAVNREGQTAGYAALLEMGLERYAFEVVVVRHPHLFSQECVERSKQRIAQWDLPKMSHE